MSDLDSGKELAPASLTPEQAQVVRDLADLLAPEIGSAVDDLHVAAVLESRGLNDETVQQKYGFEDIFVLAGHLTSHLPEASDEPVGPTPAPSGPGSLRTLLHGPLYLAPTVVYPAVSALVGTTSTMRGLVTSTAVGWIWGMASSSAAYQLRGSGREASAARTYRLLTGVGVGVAGLLASMLALARFVSWATVPFVVLLAVFQFGAGVLVFYRREGLLGAALVPAVALGGVALIAGRPEVLVVPVVVACIVSSAAVVAACWLVTQGAMRRRESGVAPDVRRIAMRALPSVLYAVACATLMLSIDARFFSGRLDLAVAAAPLVVAMGAVEWRANRFVSGVGALLDSGASTDEVASGAWRLMVRELATVAVIVGAPSCVLLLWARHEGLLSNRGALLVDAHAVLGCVFFLGFLLARHQRFPQVLLVMCAAVGLHLGASAVFAQRWPPNGEVVVFLATVLALLVVFVIAFRVGVRRLYHFTW